MGRGGSRLRRAALEAAAVQTGCSGQTPTGGNQPRRWACWLLVHLENGICNGSSGCPKTNGLQKTWAHRKTTTPWYCCGRRYVHSIVEPTPRPTCFRIPMCAASAQGPAPAARPYLPPKSCSQLVVHQVVHPAAPAIDGKFHSPTSHTVCLCQKFGSFCVPSDFTDLGHVLCR